MTSTNHPDIITAEQTQKAFTQSALAVLSNNLDQAADILDQACQASDPKHEITSIWAVIALGSMITADGIREALDEQDRDTTARPFQRDEVANRVLISPDAEPLDGAANTLVDLLVAGLNNETDSQTVAIRTFADAHGTDELGRLLQQLVGLYASLMRPVPQEGTRS